MDMDTDNPMMRIHKYETEFVDHIDYRLIFRGQLWAEWSVRGDSFFTQADTVIDTPFFTTNIAGGWLSPSEYHTTTKVCIRWHS
jgi:hypothetical protein